MRMRQELDAAADRLITLSTGCAILMQFIIFYQTLTVVRKNYFYFITCKRPMHFEFVIIMPTNPVQVLLNEHNSFQRF